MRNRAIRPVAAMLSVLLLAALPAQAGPIPFSAVVRVNGGQSGGQTQELRLRSVTQQQGSTPATTSGDTKGTTQQGTETAPSSLISTQAGPQEGQQQGNVEVVEEGDVSGTVCDCGEIMIPSGFKFPWFALGGVPLVCATGACTKDKKICTENCGGEIPEPSTLLLLGTGLTALGAGMRRRYRLRKQGRNLPNTTEV